MAHILVKTVDEFKGMNPKDVVQYIEGEVYVASVPVEPGLTNYLKEQDGTDSEGCDKAASKSGKGERLVGLNTENQEINEGMVRFDIIFYVNMKDGRTQIIVNVEAQKSNPKQYNLLNRGIFYACRMISSQKNREFVKSEYDDIKRVASIWVVMGMAQNSMTDYRLTKEVVLGNTDWKGMEDMLSVVMIGIADKLPPKDDKDYELHRLLGALLSKSLSKDERRRIINSEYNIDLEDYGEEMNVMCNLGEGIYEDGLAEGEARGITRGIALGEERGEARGIALGEERGEARGIALGEARVILNMSRKGYSYEQIADAVDKDVTDIEAVIKEHQAVLV